MNKIYNTIMILAMLIFGYTLIDKFFLAIKDSTSDITKNRIFEPIKNQINSKNQKLKEYLNSYDTKVKFNLSNNLDYEYIIIKQKNEKYKVYAIPKVEKLRSGKVEAKIFEDIL